MPTHAHSTAALREETSTGTLGRRAEMILTAAQQAPDREWTDRRMAMALGFVEMNAVRPRITELIEAGLLVETGSVEDPITLKTVRTWRAAGTREVQAYLTRNAPPLPDAAQPELPGIFG